MERYVEPPKSSDREIRRVKKWKRKNKFTSEYTLQDAFENALEDGDERKVKYFLKSTPRLPPETIPRDDRTNELIFAARRGFDGAVEILLENNNKDIIDDPGLKSCTALHYASMFGHEDIVRMLLKHSADVDIQNNNGSTPLHCAVRNSHYRIANLLIQNGADVNAKDYFESSVLCVASEDKKFYSSKSVACVLRLLMSGAKIDDKALRKDSYNMLKHIKKGTRNRLYFAAVYGLADLTCELICLGETIVNYENYMWEMDRTGLLEKLANGKKVINGGQFSKLERKVFQDIAFFFVRKFPTVACKVFWGVRSYMTYLG
eukprot:g5266.t1